MADGFNLLYEAMRGWRDRMQNQQNQYWFGKALEPYGSQGHPMDYYNSPSYYGGGYGGGGGGGGGGGRVSGSMQQRAQQYLPLFQSAAQQSGVPVNILLGIASQESGFNPAARGPTGDFGMMQFTGPTAQRYGVNPWDVKSSVYGAARLLADNYKRFGSWDRAISAYNTGGPWNPSYVSRVNQYGSEFGNVGDFRGGSVPDPSTLTSVSPPTSGDPRLMQSAYPDASPENNPMLPQTQTDQSGQQQQADTSQDQPQQQDVSPSQPSYLKPLQAKGAQTSDASTPAQRWPGAVGMVAGGDDAIAAQAGQEAQQQARQQLISAYSKKWADAKMPMLSKDILEKRVDDLIKFGGGDAATALKKFQGGQMAEPPSTPESQAALRAGQRIIGGPDLRLGPLPAAIPTRGSDNITSTQTPDTAPPRTPDTKLTPTDITPSEGSGATPLEAGIGYPIPTAQQMGAKDSPVHDPTSPHSHTLIPQALKGDPDNAPGPVPAGPNGFIPYENPVWGRGFTMPQLVYNLIHAGAGPRDIGAAIQMAFPMLNAAAQENYHQSLEAMKQYGIDVGKGEKEADRQSREKIAQDKIDAALQRANLSADTKLTIAAASDKIRQASLDQKGQALAYNQLTTNTKLEMEARRLYDKEQNDKANYENKVRQLDQAQNRDQQKQAMDQAKFALDKWKASAQQRNNIMRQKISTANAQWMDQVPGAQEEYLQYEQAELDAVDQAEQDLGASGPDLPAGPAATSTGGGGGNAIPVQSWLNQPRNAATQP